MSDTTLYEDAPDGMRSRMSDPPGGTQDPTMVAMVELRAELDRKIFALSQQRRALHQAIEKGCVHPLERRARESRNNTDTRGCYMRGDHVTLCRDCGKQLKVVEG